MESNGEVGGDDNNVIADDGVTANQHSIVNDTCEYGKIANYCTLRKNNREFLANNLQQCDNRAVLSINDKNENIARYCTLGRTGGKTAENYQNTNNNREIIMGNENSVENGKNSENEMCLERLRSENLKLFENTQEESGENDENLANYCTLRRKVAKQDKENLVDNYCTLQKKKKLKLKKNFEDRFPEESNKKLEIYLSELDAYLDEYETDEEADDGEERNYKMLENEDDSSLDLSGFFDIEQEEENEKIGEKIDESFEPVKVDIANFCTLPKKKRVHFVDSEEIFQRGGKLRNTISSPSQHRSRHLNNESLFKPIKDIKTRSKDDTYTPSNTTSQQPPRRQLSWLRNSMRRTRPIPLPEQDEEAEINAENKIGDNLPQCIVGNEQSNPITAQPLTVNLNEAPNVPQQTNITGTVPNNANAETDILTYLNSNEASTNDQNRPRQTGRRSADARPRIMSLTAERDVNSNQMIIRQNSAPVGPSHHQNHHRFLGSETSSIGSSRNPSPVSLMSTTTFSSTATGNEQNNERSRSSRQTTEQPATTDTTFNPPTATPDPIIDHFDDDPEDDDESKLKWPHVISRCLALTFCTLGLFSISRFAIFSIHFGANFIVQFLILSFLFGIPMLWLQMCLGSKIKGGPVTMWKISPICKGIGISLLLAQGLITLYSAISLGWVLVYFRDSFVSRSEKYRWQEMIYRSENQSSRLVDTVADYFNGVVLQRLHSGFRGGTKGIGTVRFQLAFNLAILWTFVFVVLCKGIRSFGKIVIGLALGSMVGLIAICSKFLSMVNYDSVQNIFPATDWQEFFLNSRCWFAAAQETFLTWGLLGVSTYSMCCRSSSKQPNRIKTELRRDAILVVLFTISGLMLAAVFGSACVQILNNRGYFYYPASYETIGGNHYLLPINQPLPPNVANIPAKWMIRYSSVLGESFTRPGNHYSAGHSGYQAIRLITELLPSTLAAATQENIAPIWSLLGFLTLLFFGLGQLCAMWKPIAGAIGNSPSAVLLSCVTGLFMGIPMATESGITIIHFLDTILGGAWWLLVLWIVHILAIFLLRGRPFTSDILVNDLKMMQSLSAFIAFAWNFLLPVGLIFLCILEYRVSNCQSLFMWSATRDRGQYYWPLWARQIGGILQIFLLILVPLVGIIQIYRYLSRGPPDILDRIDLLYRPLFNNEPSHRPIYTRRPAPHLPTEALNNSTTIISLETRAPIDDAPPKYTPPPSYTTATGARIAKMLRNSIRRSVRRIMGETSRNPRQRPSVQQQTQSSNPASSDELPPPDYSSVLMNLSSGPESRNTIAGTEIGPRALYNSETLQGRRRSLNNETNAHITANDVVHILRPTTASRIMSNISRTPSLGYNNVDQIVRTALNRRHSRSVENLVLAAAPLGQSSIVTLSELNNDDNDSVI